MHHRFVSFSPGASWKRSLDTGIGGVYHGHHQSVTDALSSRWYYIVETGSSSLSLGASGFRSHTLSELLSLSRASNPTRLSPDLHIEPASFPPAVKNVSCRRPSQIYPKFDRDTLLCD